MMRYLLFFPSFLPLAEYVCCAVLSGLMGISSLVFDVSERRARIRTTVACWLAVHVDMRRRRGLREIAFFWQKTKGRGGSVLFLMTVDGV